MTFELGNVIYHGWLIVSGGIWAIYVFTVDPSLKSRKLWVPLLTLAITTVLLKMLLHT